MLSFTQSTPSSTSDDKKLILNRVLTEEQRGFLEKLPNSVIAKEGSVINLCKSQFGKDYPIIFKRRFAGREGAKTLHISTLNEFGVIKPVRFWLILALDLNSASREMFRVCSKNAFVNLKLIEKVEGRQLFFIKRKQRLDELFNQQAQTTTDEEDMLFIVHNKYEPDHVKRCRLMMDPEKKYLFEAGISTSINGDRLFINIKDMLTTPLTTDQFEKMTGTVVRSETPSRKRHRF